MQALQDPQVVLKNRLIQPAREWSGINRESMVLQRYVRAFAGIAFAPRCDPHALSIRERTQCCIATSGPRNGTAGLGSGSAEFMIAFDQLRPSWPAGPRGGDEMRNRENDLPIGRPAHRRQPFDSPNAPESRQVPGSTSTPGTERAEWARSSLPPDNRYRHPAQHRNTFTGTAPVPPASQAQPPPPASQAQPPPPASEAQHMPLASMAQPAPPMVPPQSMPTAGLSRAPRIPNPVSVSPAPAPLRPPAEPTAIHGFPATHREPGPGLSADETGSPPLDNAWPPRSPSGTFRPRTVPPATNEVTERGVRPVPGWPVSERPGPPTDEADPSAW